MALQLDEEETEFFSAAMSFLDDFPDAQLHHAPLASSQQLEHQLALQQQPQPPRFEQLQDAAYLPHVVAHSDDDGSLASLDGVELQGLTELCFPTANATQAEPSQAAAHVNSGGASALTWETALTNISRAYEPVNPTSPAPSSAGGTPTGNSKGCGRPRAASRSRAKGKDKAPAERSKSKSHLPYNPNKARDERKLELIYLRKKVKEMEEQLETLQDSRDTKVVNDAANGVRRKRLLGASTSDKPVLGVSTIAVPPSSGISEGAESSLPSVWKELCLRQLQRRVKAERENSRLKRELESQIKVAKSMEKLLNRPSSIKEESTSQHKRARSVHVPPTDPMADAAIFDELIAGAEASYYDVDTVFKEVGLSDLETARRGAHVREGEKGMYLDIFANSVLPFDMCSTGEAVWEYFKGLRKHRGPLYQKTMKSLEPTEDTIIENFALELFANNTRADFRIRQVVKRFVEEDRVMVVWTAHVEPISVTNELFSGFGFREKAYVVCKRPPSTANSSSSESFTLLQRCLRITPHAIVKQEHSKPSDSGHHPSTHRLDSATVGTLTEFVLSLCAADMAADQELIENVLVDQAINQHTTSQR